MSILSIFKCLSYMSGHSKWHSIRHKKAAVDAKKGKIFTKLTKNLTIAAKEGGGDVETNFKLRLAIENAKSMNMPKDNIERAIKKGTGELDGVTMEEIVYEAMGPEGSAIIIETITDNKNRTVASIKSVVSKKGGGLTGSNSILWMFERKGVLMIPKNNFSDLPDDDIELLLIDAGAEDINKESIDNEDIYKVITLVEDLKTVQDVLNENNIKIADAGLEYIAKEPVNMSEKGLKTLNNILEALDDEDDVNNLYCNVDF